MRVDRIEASVHRLPVGKEMTDAIHCLNAIEVIVARVFTDGGAVGTGWTYTLGTGGTALRALIADSLAPLLVGEDPDNIERLWEKMWRGLHAIGSSGATSLAISAVDIALWDLLGKARGLPLFRLLGGHRDKVPVYGSGINLYFSMDDLIAQTKGFLAQNVHGVKIKVGRPDVGEDLERLAAVREVIGPHMPLMVDANQGWSVGEAINRARAMEPFSPFWIEEPVLADDHAGYQVLARSISIPIATGETHYTRFQFADLFHRGAVAFVQADVNRVGGITEWMKVAHMAQGFNLPMCPHGLEEIHLHLTCAVSNGYIVEHVVAGERKWGHVANPIELVDRYLVPRETPGHGVELDEESLARFKMA